MKSWNYLWIVALLIYTTGTANAQNRIASKKQLPASSANLIEAMRQYKANSESLLKLQEDELKKATEKLEQIRELVTDGLVARNELAAAEASVSDLQAALQVTRKKIGDSDHMVAEIQSAEIQRTNSLAQAGLVSKPRSFVKSTVLRYDGGASWSLARLAGIQSFFSSTFGRALPTSTVGQSATHNRMGWDHRNSVDVGLHPDSVEGRALISFLQAQGIPFLAFRGPIPGVSTGAHVHIGRPSQRLS